jgi:non-ribosomal peptide synthase protein (TIGR01720 family)
VGVSLWGKGRLFVDRDALERDGRVEPESSSDETIQLVGCGRPSQGVDLRVVDPDTLQELPDGRVGELWVDSPSKAVGYWREPDVSVACFHASLQDGAQDGYLRTGDLGFLWGGEVYITGRMKDLVILNGRNLHPADLEETIAEASPLIRKGRVAVFAVPVSKAAGIEGGEGLAVIMEVSEKRPAPAMLDSLVNRVRDRLLSQHRVPCQVLVVGRAGTIRKTTSGKLRRQAMRQAYLDGELGPEPHRVDMLQGVSPVAPSQQPPIQEQPRETAAPVTMDALLAWLVREVATELGVSENAVSGQASLRELGADSLLVLGLSAAIAERWRVELGPDEVAESVSLEQLARTVQSALPDAMVARVPAPEPNSDPLPLTPTQAWIVETVGYRLPHHWNLPVMLASDTPLRPEIVAAALEMLAGRHMALRMRLAPGGEDLKSWRQIFDADIRVPVRCVDVGGLDPDALRTAVEADAAAVQTTLNLVTGPVIRAVVYRTADATADLLFLCLHHFLIDGVSLRLLLREFEATYLDLESGRPVEPRARPQSYADWTTGLAGNARSHETRAELGYWREMLDGPVGRLPYDHPDDENLEGVARALWFELAPATGDTLLEAVGGPLGVGLESIMLHALEMTFCQWIGDATAPLIDVQRHGRSMGPERGRAERVIAWTNDVFPFRISPAGPGSGPGLRRTLEIQRRLDRVPRSGHGYGLLRYLGDPADRAALCALPTAPVKLLCHSRLAAAGRTEGGRFRLSDEDPGLSYGADLPARYALLIYASVMGGQLRIDITYGGGRFDEDTVKRFQGNLEAALVALARDYRASSASNQKVFDAEGEDGVASDQRMGHRNPDDRTMPRE